MATEILVTKTVDAESTNLDFTDLLRSVQILRI